jgi:hypothetical protein
MVKETRQNAAAFPDDQQKFGIVCYHIHCLLVVLHSHMSGVWLLVDEIAARAIFAGKLLMKKSALFCFQFVPN